MIHIDGNVAINEIDTTNCKLICTQKRNNVVTNIGLSFLAQRAVGNSLLTNLVDHKISVVAVGNGASINPEHAEDINLASKIDFTTVTEEIITVDGLTYYNIRNKLFFTTNRSWKLTFILTPYHLPLGTIFDEIGLYMCKEDVTTNQLSDPHLFARVCLFPGVTISEDKIAHVTWNFGLRYQYAVELD